MMARAQSTVSTIVVVSDRLGPHLAQILEAQEEDPGVSDPAFLFDMWTLMEEVKKSRFRLSRLSSLWSLLYRFIAPDQKPGPHLLLRHLPLALQDGVTEHINLASDLFYKVVHNMIFFSLQNFAGWNLILTFFRCNSIYRADKVTN